ncbi:MAG: phage/plasmid primase, P4 family, partial [Desulfobacteraceae bacterium]|nr:phage/plasmid primase, P4 family [Desulfobacteraceae bacterium]
MVNSQNTNKQQEPQGNFKDYIRQAIEGQSGEIRLECPDCDSSGEKTLCVNVDTGKFICQRCGEKGDVSASSKNNRPDDQTNPERLWNLLKPALWHPYLKAKGVKDHGLRVMEPPEGSRILAIPLYIGDILVGILYIDANGKKNLLSKEKGGIKKGASFQVGNGSGNIVYVCEGYATAASTYEATDGIVYMCVDAGNLIHAAKNLREKYPDHEFIFCADNDTGKPEHDKSYNIGFIKAIKASKAVGNSKVVMPEQAGFDFNDLHLKEGLEAVRERLMAATNDFPEVADDTVFNAENEEDAADRINARKDFEEQINSTDDFEELTENLFRKIKKSNQTEASKYHLYKKTAKKAGVPVQMLMDLDKAREESGPGQQIDIIEEIIKKLGAENILHAMGFVWMWRQSGVWMQLDDREVKRLIQDKLKNSGTDFDKNFVASLLDLFKTETFIPNHQFNVNRDTINTLNGELSWTNEKWELHAARRESYRTTQIPIEYDPAALAPLFEKFLNDIFCDDPDRLNKIILVLEMIGYCLLSSTEYEKFILLIGPGANGKSVLLAVIQALLGFENTVAVQPGQLDNKFQRAHLSGKLANIISELPEGGQLPDAQQKAITSGELITAEHKFKTPFDFIVFCTLIFATNHMPHTRDFSDALFRRAIVITFNRVFQEYEQDKHLAKKLKSELPGILNLA